MTAFHQLFVALWHQDFQVLTNPQVVGFLYLVLFVVIVLENGFLPTTFLPGDSLLILTGALIAKGSLDFFVTILILSTASALGSWLGYLQGLWLGENPRIKKWMSRIPEKYHDKTEALLEKYGVLALLIARFTAFVRTLMPMIIGLSSIHPKRFHLINWLSGVLWVSVLITLSYSLGQTDFFQEHQKIIMHVLTVIPLILVSLGLLSSIYFMWKNRESKTS